MIIKGVSIERAGGKGVCIGHSSDGRTLLVKGAAPGDIVDVKIIRKKKKHFECIIENIVSPSINRVDPLCEHAELCGGCSWQHIKYEAQAEFKGQEVKDNLTRIGNMSGGDFKGIIHAPEAYRYRNKLEFSFSSNRWLSPKEISSGEEITSREALGYHAPGMWDKIMDINTCHLQPEPSNAIRLFIKSYAQKNGLSFYHPRKREGLLRTMMLRSTLKGDWMVVIQFFESPEDKGIELLRALANEFLEISSIYFAHNTKGNDSIYDLDLHLFCGKSSLTEYMPSALNKGKDLSFQIGPKSFYQTNPVQANRLYSEVLKLADIQKEDIVYDLYTGTGTIALFMAQVANKVVGIESVPEAIKAAKQNAINNNISNTTFLVGDMRNVFDENLWLAHGTPDILVTDPPRDGMHPKVVKRLNELRIPRIVYVSCNSATQARDLDTLNEVYKVDTIQPIDMFPQTHHVENILVLSLRDR